AEEYSERLDFFRLAGLSGLERRKLGDLFRPCYCRLLLRMPLLYSALSRAAISIGGRATSKQRVPSATSSGTPQLDVVASGFDWQRLRTTADVFQTAGVALPRHI